MGFLRDLGVALGLIEDRPAPPTTTRDTPDRGYNAGYQGGGQTNELNGISHLYHMTHINNLQNILERGLLSHNLAHRSRAVTDISDRDVNDRRAWRSIDGKPLHEYVPLYFNPTNPMLYRRKGIQDSIAILAINKNLLSQEGVWFTDGNAASNGTAFYYYLNDLNNLDWDCIWDQYWNHHDDGRRKRCSEVLVPDSIHPSRIERIIVRDAAARAAVLRRVRVDIPVVIQPWRYF